jgi:hypothetical protein
MISHPHSALANASAAATSDTLRKLRMKDSL